ncbi:unnamed protein product, partial [marine sediment metagenome]
KSFHLGRWIVRGGWYPDRKLRLFKKAKGRWSGRDLHECVEVTGRIEKLNNPILHFTYRDLSDHLLRIDKYTAVAARYDFERGRKAGFLDLSLRPCFKFFRMYILKLGFLEGWAGFILASTGAYYVFLKYAKLWELNLKGQGQSPGIEDEG